MGLAYRELIGSLYESWTIGIERVYKWLTNSIIQRCEKWQKQGFEAKERESSPRSHTLLYGDFSQGEGECGDGKVEDNEVKMSSFTHTQLSQATFKGGIVATEKGKK